jgi:hypothetical protein
MKQAIITKFLGPTNTKGARVKAYASGARISITIPWDHAESGEKNHAFAARLLALRLDWTGTLQAGVISPGSVAHVFID